MKARISVSTKEPFEIFYNAECDFEYYGSNAQITYIEQFDKENQVLVKLGVSNKDLLIVRTIYQGKVADKTPGESVVKLLSMDRMDTMRAKISLDEMDVFLFASGMKASFGEDFAKFSIPCCFGNGELKTDRTTLFVECKLVSDF